MKLPELLKMPMSEFEKARKEKPWFVVKGNGEKRHRRICLHLQEQDERRLLIYQS